MNNRENPFERAFNNMLSEMNTAGEGGALGDAVDGPDNTDWYAPEDNRMPKILGKIQRRNKKKTAETKDDDDNSDSKPPGDTSL